MDEIVLRGMAKWPDVPAVYGWLRLDRRGNWHIKDDRVTHEGIIAFIGRNYERDAEGRWFFQNGPQRVFVTLAYAPFVYRIVSPEGEPLALEAHTGQPVSKLSGAWIDENGTVLLESELGPGNVHDRDLSRLIPAFIDVNGNPLEEAVFDSLASLLQQGHEAPLWLQFRDVNVRVAPIRSESAPRRFGYVAQPVQPAGEPACN